MILKGYPRISETFISNEILLLEKQGFNIRLFSMRQPREAFCHDSVRQIQAGVDYLPEELFKCLPTLLSHNGLLAIRKPRQYVTALGLALRRFLRTRRLATIKHLLQAGYLVHHLLPDSGVTHLHAHFAHSPTSVALFAGRLSGLPFSFTAHAKDIYTSDVRQLQEKMAMSRFVLTCTEYNRRYLLGLREKAFTPVYCIYHGIDVRLFSFHPPQPSCRISCRVLTIARLTPKKGLPVVLKAIRCLRDRGMAVEHILIGDGEDRDDILKRIEQLDLTHTTRWLGTLPHEKVLDYFRTSDVFVIGCEIADNGDRDGIPNVIVESMACGVPVVATRVSAIPEIVENGETGLLVPSKDPYRMADAMFELLSNDTLRRKVIANGRQRVEQDFDNQRLIHEMAGIYERAGISRHG